MNQDLRLLWKETIDSGTWPEELPKMWPLQYGEVETSALVFVGINPAYAKRDARHRNEASITDTDVLLDAHGDVKLCETISFPHAPYFDQFDNFIKDIPFEHWIHLDIFAVRDTDQSRVKRALGLLGDYWPKFAERQFSIFLDLLIEIDPPAIVVPNAFASHILRKRLAIGDMSADHCYHFAVIAGRKTPVFFSGMLTGQRALDIYSRQRLMHLVRKTLRKTA